MPQDVSAYILVGGKSRRMGRPKHMLPWQGTTLLEHLLRKLRPWVREVVLVTKPGGPDLDYGCRVLYDHEPESAAAAGVRRALAEPGPPWRWVLACDMPHVDEKLLGMQRRLAERQKAAGACCSLPPYDDLQPFPALWHRDLARRLSSWGWTLRHWLRQAGLAVVELDEAQAGMLLNLNRLDEYEAARGGEAGMKSKSKLTHLDPKGQVRMVHVGDKTTSQRRARAGGWVQMSPEALAQVSEGDVAKGNVFAVARIAGIQAAKRTSSLIPLCHNLNLDHVEVSLRIETAESRIVLESSVECRAVTGAEMEAIVAVAIAAATIYDMCKSMDKGMRIGGIRLIEKSGGKSGVYRSSS